MHSIKYNIKGVFYRNHPFFIRFNFPPFEIYTAITDLFDSINLIYRLNKSTLNDQKVNRH